MILYLGWEMFRIFRRPFRTPPAPPTATTGSAHRNPPSNA